MKNRPLKILQVSRVYWPNLGGMEKIVEGLARNLVQRGHQCDVVTLNRSFEDGSAFEPYSLHDGVHVYRVGFVGSKRYPIAPDVWRFVERYDVVHVHGTDFLLDWLVFTRRWHNRPIVLSTHGGFFHTDYAKKLKRIWFKTLTRHTLRGVDRVLASSEHDLKLFQSISERCELARNAVDLDVYKNLQNKPEAGRFVCVGRVDVHKGIGNLLETLAALKNVSTDSFRLHVVGPCVADGLDSALENQVSKLGLEDEVVFEGRVEFERLYELVAGAELALFPSEYEAFGISVVEAMAAGVLCVVNDIKPFRDFVGDNEAGLVADFSDPNSAAAVIQDARKLTGSMRDGLCSKARSAALAYDWPASVDRFEAVYHDLLGA